MEPREKEIRLLDYWRVLVKRRWVVYTSLAVVVTTVTLGTLMVRPVYTATTRLQIERYAPKVLPFEQIVTGLSDGRDDFYETQQGLIQSRRVAREVIADLRLATHPAFGGARRGPEGEKAEAEAPIIDAFLAHLTVTPVRGSRLVDVAFTSTDPLLAARAANRVAETYIAFSSESRSSTSERASASLERQIVDLQSEIDAKEERLQSYAQEHGIISVGEKQSIAVKNLSDLSDACTKAQAARIEREARFASLREADPASLPEVLENGLVRDLASKAADLASRNAQLSGKYKPDWPEMVRLRREMEETNARLAAERQAIYAQVLGAADSAYRAARNEEEYLKRAFEDQKRQAQEMSLKEIEYNNLRLDIAGRRATLEALVKRQSEARSSAGLNDVATGNIRVVDVAEVPARPSSPNLPSNVMLSLLVGLALGMALAFVFEFLDDSVKNAEEMEASSRLPCLGVIPTLRPQPRRISLVKSEAAPAGPAASVDLISQDDPQSAVSEAFRRVRTALLVSRAGGPPRSILITSSRPGEGKTAAALNLGITLAQIGRRVLLVDADLRKPRLHAALGVRGGRGLSDHLGGDGALKEVVLPTRIPNLDVVPSGVIPPNPADLLDSDRFDDLRLGAERAGYDHLIFDSPPVHAVADPAIIAARVEAVLIVVRAGVTGREVLAHAVGQLRQMGGRVLGCILNQVDTAREDYYGGYAYRRHVDQEEADAEGRGGARDAAR